MRFHASVVTTEAVDDPFPGSVDATTASWQNERNYFTTVKPESDTTLKYLSPVLPNQPDSDSRGHGEKTLPACYQFDYTSGIVTTTFAAPVDVTGAVKDNVTVRSGRSHRSSLADHVAGFRVLNRTVNRS